MKYFIIYLSLFFSLFYSPNRGVCQESPLHMNQECLPEYRFDGRKIELTEKEWKQKLPKEVFEVLRKGKTEPPFQNAYYDNTAFGIYLCAGCDLPLFDSEAKYKSGTGWPSFWRPICKENVTIMRSYNPFASGKEVKCARCDGHIGDVFNDGPPPSGKRYCMNSTALHFVPK